MGLLFYGDISSKNQENHFRDRDEERPLCRGKSVVGSGYFDCISNKKIKSFNKYNSNCAY
ncbi:hypothetical protein [Clostridium saccharoperbutylacetonicum]